MWPVRTTITCALDFVRHAWRRRNTSYVSSDLGEMAWKIPIPGVRSSRNGIVARFFLVCCVPFDWAYGQVEDCTEIKR